MIVSNVRKCDRCGALYEAPDEAILVIKKREFREGSNIKVGMKEIDLCDACTKDVLEALAQKVEKDLLSEHRYTILQ